MLVSLQIVVHHDFETIAEKNNRYNDDSTSLLFVNSSVSTFLDKLIQIV